MGGRLNRDRRSSAKSLYAHQHELIQAVRAGNKREVESLLGQVGDPNFHTDDEKQLYPLHIAAARGDIAMLDLLLECEARVDVKSHKGEGGTPLMSALTARHPTAAMTLITRWGANCKAYDSSGRSPLHIAAQKNMYAVVRQLLRNGANPNGCDSKGHTPLKAVLRDDREIKPLDNNVLRVLLNPPEGPGRRTPGADPRLGRAEDHYTPLHLAAEKGYTEDLRLMAQSGCGVVVVDSRRRSPLCYAAHAAQVETVRVLVGDLKADINQRSTDPDKPTPLWAVATSSGHCRLEGVEVLLEGGADPDVRNSEGEMLLHRACRDGDAPLLELLLHHHTPRNTKGRHRGRIADLDARDSEGLQAIHHAAAQGHLSCVRLLLQVATVDVNAVDLAGGTALIFAAEHGHLPILKYLVDQKADWRARDGAGNDAFYIACAAGDILCAAFLLGCGLDINGQNSKGNTPLHGAARRGHLEMVRWLLCMGADKGARSTAPFEGMTTCGTPAEVVRAAVAGELLERKVGEEIMRLTEGWSEGFERSFSWRVKGSERLDTEIEEMEEEDDTMKRIEEFDDDEETTVSLDGFSLRSSKIASPLGVYCPTQAESWERDAVREKPNS
ncbi:ankyrin repeat-containing domain protein [Diplogelasinospora grovesii]|uniref:Ankyrin repeat-containing domain protein n=1 Tax=Diplogelasinospora grovesii TaxID=303347 RepID=A0AAN6S3S8_9PEZI|nr:ankyrin repeat-containing domain protein [Diplogelasinospora grovesii]